MFLSDLRRQNFGKGLREYPSSSAEIGRLLLGRGALMGCLGYAPLAEAHAPSGMKLAYDPNASKLSVTITHTVSDPSTHYVHLVKVNRNEVTVLTEGYTSQPSPDTFTYTYDVAAKEGDTLEVAAECNLAGSITVRLDVPEGEGPSTEQGKSPGLWPLHAVLMIVALVVSSIATYSLYMKRRSWWFKAHKVLGTLGALSGAVGLGAGIYMVSRAGRGHIRVPHAYLGLLTVVLVLMSPALGLLFLRSKTAKAKIRKVHIWWGRGSMVLMVVTVLAGLRLVGLI